MREHRLAGSRRSDHQHAVRASGCDLQHALGRLLAAHIGKIGVDGLVGGSRPGRADRHRLQRLGAGQVRAHGQQRCGGKHDRIAYARRLVGARCGQHKCAAIAAGRERHRQRATNRSQRTGEREFPGELAAREFARGNLAGRGEDADGDGQIEAAGVLRQIGGREIHRDLSRRKLELRGLQRGAYAILRFTDLGIRQANEVEGGQAAGEMHLDGDQRCFGTGEPAGKDDSDAHDQCPPARVMRQAPPTRDATTPTRRCLGAGSAFRDRPAVARGCRSFRAS